MNKHRRRFIKTASFLTAGLGFRVQLPAWAQGSRVMLRSPEAIEGPDITLTVGQVRSAVAGKRARHITLNGQFPGPLLRWREGDDLVIRVNNTLDETTSLHWHGLLLPFHMDGVPGVTYPGIAAGDRFTYRFPVKQAGTYWYHSHSGLQEQLGHYGPIIIDPAAPEPFTFDREYVVMLSDWTFENPHRVFSKLKKMSDNYNFQQRTLREFFRDVEEAGFDAALANRLMWGDMRMSPTDLSDVTGATYTYLVNGHSPAENWTGLFNPGEKIRLRFINASAMSIFNVRIPGLPMTVVQADGLDVQPVETDEFQIGTAETFDVIVQPMADRAFTVMCETNDRSGYAAATLATRAGMRAPVPPLRPRPILTMKDMGMSGMDTDGMDSGSPDMANMAMENPAPDTAMDHAMMGHEAMDHGGMDAGSMDHGAMNHGEMPQGAMRGPGMDHGTMEHDAMDHAGMGHAAVGHDMHATDMPAMSAMDHPATGHDMAMQPHDHPMGPGVVNVAMNPVNRLHERPLGLENEPHRVLVYTDLRSLATNPDTRPPGREIELHLTSNMERYMWSFDGVKFSEVTGPIEFRLGERLRVALVNDTMMPHPIHLHGMFFEVVTGEHDFKPRKHTITIKPGEKMAFDVTADAPGDWAFHCHLLYHMHAGMMRVVSAREHLS